MKGNIRRVAIYSRKSKFTGKGESIGNQVELCREFVRMHYADVKERTFSSMRTRASPAVIWKGRISRR